VYKEDILNTFLSGKIRLSQIDYRFFNNLSILISTGKGITTNQVALFDKLINKYSRQLRGLNIDPVEALLYKWNTNVMQSDKNLVAARLRIDHLSGNLIMNVPFNNKFIQAVRQYPRFLQYDKSSRSYIGKFNTRNLKIAYKLAKQHFVDVKTDQQIHDILEELKKFEAKYYNPTLVDCNGLLVVMACNAHLGKAIEKIKFEKTPECLETLLINYGITIDKSVWKDSKELEFASNIIWEISNNDIDIDNVLKWLKNLNYDGYVISGHTYRLKNNIFEKLRNKLEENSLASNNSSWYTLENSKKLVLFVPDLYTAYPYINSSRVFKKIIITKD
jgi:hypothetical protein